jgi:hypothetical protein
MFDIPIAIGLITAAILALMLPMFLKDLQMQYVFFFLVVIILGLISGA